MISGFLQGGMLSSAIAAIVAVGFNIHVPPSALMAAGLLGGATQATSTRQNVVYVRR